MPMISAACHQVIFFARARKITSCIFIARTIAAFELRVHASHAPLLSPAAKRTDHVLSQPGHIMC